MSAPEIQRAAPAVPTGVPGRDAPRGRTPEELAPYTNEWVQFDDAERAFLEAQTYRRPAPQIPAEPPVQVDPRELDRMWVDAALGRPQPQGLSPEALALWPEILADLDEIERTPWITQVEYPSWEVNISGP